MSIWLDPSNLQNPAQRRYLGLPDDGRGVVVRHVIEAGPAGKVLKQGDVLLSIDDHAIASDWLCRTRR
jgi:S1-C subfamily serine protease